ncbi:MAG TPA: RNB domain-containing ribonuclease, partial [Polyangiaceae bacterium]|nr:RNB domain-containing ribonuclease [Polyangiaceae bacterium]
MSTRLPSRNEILDLLGADPRPLHLRDIASRLRVSEVDHLGLERLLDNLSLEGVLTARPGPRFELSEGIGYKVSEEPVAGHAPGVFRTGVASVSPVARTPQQAVAPREVRDNRGTGAEREGLLTVHPRGFGFVASLGTGATGDDVFIPPDAMGGAIHGDRVKIRIRARSARGAEGEVVAIIERGIKRVAGTLRRRGKSAWLEPDDTRVRGPIVLPRAIDAQGPAGNSGNDGDAVVVTLTRWPESRDENPEGRIEQVLGRPGELSVEAAKILVLEAISESHSEKAVAEAEAFGETVPGYMMEGRTDLRHVPLPTIDPEDARDHDDAVWVERSARGGYKAWIAIADVSTYVTTGSAIDDEAKVRGCTIYLPDRAIPMLPRALAANLCSLLPGVDRLCLCVEAELDATGHVVKYGIVRGVMRSRAKLTYGGVARALGLSEEA